MLKTIEEEINPQRGTGSCQSSSCSPTSLRPFSSPLSASDVRFPRCFPPVYSDFLFLNPRRRWETDRRKVLFSALNTQTAPPGKYFSSTDLSSGPRRYLTCCKRNEWRLLKQQIKGSGPGYEMFVFISHAGTLKSTWPQSLNLSPGFPLRQNCWRPAVFGFVFAAKKKKKTVLNTFLAWSLSLCCGGRELLTWHQISSARYLFKLCFLTSQMKEKRFSERINTRVTKLLWFWRPLWDLSCEISS